MSLNIKSFLIHQYLYNLQFGINGLKYSSNKYDGLSTIIRAPYFNLKGHPLTIYAIPITKAAWVTENPKDYPILLSDNGHIVDSFRELNINFNINVLLAWQLETSYKFHNQIDLKTPKEIKNKFGIIPAINDWNIIALTSHFDLYRQLCVYTAFILTIQDLYLYFYRDVK